MPATKFCFAYNGLSTQDDFIPRDSICFCKAFTENVPHRSLRKVHEETNYYWQHSNHFLCRALADISDLQDFFMQGMSNHNSHFCHFVGFEIWYLIPGHITK
jgi:hypothetical protein